MRKRFLPILIALVVFLLGLAPLVAAGAQAPPDPLSLMPLEVKVGQMLIAGVTGTTADADARAMIDDLHIGNVILMGRNVDSPKQVLALTQGLQALAVPANGVPLLIATDQEGGLVQRLNYYSGFTPMPPAALAGAAHDPALMRRYGQMVGAELAAVGVNMDMAPDLDVNTNPTNPVIGALGRSFGTTAQQVETSTLPFIAGLHDAGVIATGKHFPGHGRTTTDSHEDMPYVTADRAALEAVDLAPFKAAVASGIGAIMIAHVLYGALDPHNPATVSSAIQTGLLREQLGFKGVIVTDDMGMKGITDLYPPQESGVRAVLAGADMLTCVRMPQPDACSPQMIGPLRAGLIAAVKSGRIPMSRIDASVRRILALKARFHVGPASGAGLSQIQSAAHFRIIGAIYDEVAEQKAKGQ
jgi:beta-N-acetylhexosaminidase